MALRLRPDEPRLGCLLVTLTDQVASGAQLMAEALGGDQTGREEIARRLQHLDHETEATMHAVLRALSATFVTPFDREDVYQVAWTLRQCVARMDAVVDEIVLFHLGEVSDGVTELVRFAVRAAELAQEAVPRLTQPRGLADPWIELTRLGKQAGREQRRLLAEVTALPEPTATARLVALAMALRQVVEAFEDVAHALQTVAVKEG
ncbi:MAG TPA: DUF47 family protein [Kineosporiaceae bacterium]|nr:DUF47 family protein [Kineosporiaceae bacterium]